MKTTQTISHVTAQGAILYTLSFTGNREEPIDYNTVTLVKERVIAWHIETSESYMEGTSVGHFSEVKPITCSGTATGLHAIYDQGLQTFYIGEEYFEGTDEELLAELIRIHRKNPPKFFDPNEAG